MPRKKLNLHPSYEAAFSKWVTTPPGKRTHERVATKFPMLFFWRGICHLGRSGRWKIPNAEEDSLDESQFSILCFCFWFAHSSFTSLLRFFIRLITSLICFFCFRLSSVRFFCRLVLDFKTKQTKNEIEAKTKQTTKATREGNVFSLLFCSCCYFWCGFGSTIF